jgi:hypothetical protein
VSRVRLAAVAATLTCGLLVGGAGTAAAAQTPTDLTKTIAVAGTAKNGKKFTGTYTINRFVTRNGVTRAVGKLRGKLKNRRIVRRNVRMPVSNFAATGPLGSARSSQIACRVLTLTLGPLDLNLLGLRVQLNQINLRITAIPGGGLLGDLLCSLSNLLNPAQILGNQLAAVLNSLLALVPNTPTGGR